MGTMFNLSYETVCHQTAGIFQQFEMYVIKGCFIALLCWAVYIISKKSFGILQPSIA